MTPLVSLNPRGTNFIKSLITLEETAAKNPGEGVL